MKISFMKKYLIIAFGFFMPLLSFAQASKIHSIDSTNATSLVTTIAKFINYWVIPIMVLVALAYFIAGVVMYIGENEDTKRKEKKQKMFWGLVGLFVMLSVWSLVFVIANTFNISTNTGSQVNDSGQVTKSSNFYQSLESQN